MKGDKSGRFGSSPRFTPAQNRATIARFYMMTQTSLSAAAPASQGYFRLARRIKWHRFTLSLEGHSCLPRGTKGLCAVAKPGTQPIEAAASLPVHVLIANLELESHLTHRKLSPLRNPNRKFSRVLREPWRIESFSMRLQSLTRKGRRANPHAGGRSPMTPFLIHGSAIKSQRNPFTNSNLRISNRR